MVKPSLQGVGAEARGAWEMPGMENMLGTWGRRDLCRAGDSMLSHGTSQEVEEKS